MTKYVTANVRPLASLDILSPIEIERLQDASDSGLYPLFRQCALAALNCGSDVDSIDEMLDENQDFDIRISSRFNGIQLELINAPAAAFVGEKILPNIRELLFSVVRDLLYTTEQFERLNGSVEDSITEYIYHHIRNAGAFKPHQKPNVVACWGGHSLKDPYEGEYARQVGYALGIRKLNTNTGSGPGVMSSVHEGALLGHYKQRYDEGCTYGMSEPQILAAEAPNHFNSCFMVLPTIELRLQAFIQFSAGVIVFPGGAGTLEEIMAAITVAMMPENKAVPFPIIFTGPESAKGYFEAVDHLIRSTLGDEAASTYEIIIGDPIKVAKRMDQMLDEVYEHRTETHQAYHFNWELKIPESLQNEFVPSHENMASLKLYKDMSPSELAAEMRKAMSGIVAGNVKVPWTGIIKEKGPYKLQGDPEIMAELDKVLRIFCDQGRMKIAGNYKPCYELV
ncbi:MULTISPECIES: nucleotide 5'-monophosphate nucleosidase PpnN [unclassified Marinobacterium]|jgi:predicted Rossmann-fold nucleotide-binding protein|uniref:nucleotide 5'-monophosphate nucleosidase PpnN n=1 Tax=unclassified Marinobacterium TaxID=2644139 RepID=UPI001569D8B1|nr:MULTISPECIES: nucleotide 5'-monophosphate nucleosidase PpnN [unclassified Marinobacterium]NRP46348.1 LOG family protein YgdH [Marinobacterium sp. xm-d-543]NRQ22684.1 LOG family protein YgdH [Marinobacterium sp. xm-m-312]